MSKKKNRQIRTPVDCAWGLFERTGTVGSYLLYRKIVDKQNEEE